MPANPSGSRPRQARAVATRLRIYEAAMAEFERVGVDEARVEDIVREAGVAWGTFFHYFPRKQDVLLESSAQVCVAFHTAIRAGIVAGDPLADVVDAAFAALVDAAPRSRPLRIAVLREVNENPGTLGAYLDGRAPTLVPAMAELVEEGQHRGEIRADQPAAALATILVYGVFAANRRQRVGPPFDVVTPLWQLAQEVILAGMRT